MVARVENEALRVLTSQLELMSASLAKVVSLLTRNCEELHLLEGIRSS